MRTKQCTSWTKPHGTVAWFLWKRPKATSAEIAPLDPVRLAMSPWHEFQFGLGLPLLDSSHVEVSGLMLGPAFASSEGMYFNTMMVVITWHIIS